MPKTSPIIRSLLLFSLVAGALLLLPQSASAAGCSCSAPDGSCSGSINCPGQGCACVCVNGGNCECCCQRACLLGSPRLSLDLNGMPASDVAAVLSRATKRKVEVLKGGDQMVSLTLRNSTLIQALRRLQEFTEISLAVDGREFNRAKLPPGAEVSICAQDAALQVVLDRLSLVTGATFEVPDMPPAHVTLKTQGTLEDVVSQLSGAANVNIGIRPPAQP